MVQVDTFTGARKSLVRAPRENCSLTLDEKKQTRFALCFDSKNDQGEYDTVTELYRREADGSWTSLEASRSLLGRADLLLSYLPSPGTVVYLGYGSAADASETERPSDARRTSDGLFVKVSYLFRVKGSNTTATMPAR
jgi:hypothetical protein